MERTRGGVLTPPIHRGREIRSYIRDRDGHLSEVGRSTGILEGRRRPSVHTSAAGRAGNVGEHVSS